MATTWQDRVVAEKKDLDDKIDKLTQFLNTPKPDDVSEAQIVLLQRQFQLMTDYSKVLDDRLNTP